MTNKKIIHLLFFLSIIIASALRVFTFLHTQHMDFESVFRITESYQYSKINPWYHFWNLGIISGGTGGQRGYYLLNSLLMSIINSPDIIARLSSLFFGILSIVFYFPLLRLLFTKEVSLAATFALAFYHIHIQLSVVPMANAGFILFTILSLYCFFRYCFFSNTNNHFIFLILTAAFTILATSFRLEAWLLVLLYPSILVSQKKPLQAIILLLLSSLYITNTLYLMLKYTGNAFMFLQNPLLHIHGAKTSMGFFSQPENLPIYGSFQGLIWIDSLRYSLSSPLLILGAIGMLRVKTHKKQALFFVLFLSFLTMLTLRQIISNHSPFIRYISILAIFFIPFIFQGARNCALLILSMLNSSTSKRRKIFFSIMGGILLFFVFTSTAHLANNVYSMQYPDKVYILKNWIKKNARAGDLFFSSFNNLDMHAASISNNYILSNPIKAQAFLSKLHEIEYSKKNVVNFKEKSSPAPRNLLEKFMPKFENRYLFLNVCADRTNPHPHIKRIVVLLSPEHHTFSKKHLPGIFKKIDMNYNGLFYSGVITCN